MYQTIYEYGEVHAFRYIFTSTGKRDIIKIFATIIGVVECFTTNNPSFLIYFEGSTPERMLLYNRILKTYYQSFREKFAIAGLIKTDNGKIYVHFDPTSTDAYLAFLIKRK